MSALSGAVKGLTFAELKQECELIDGNLSRHLKALEEAGAVMAPKAFVGAKPRTTVFLSARGRAGFLDYRQALEKVLKSGRCGRCGGFRRPSSAATRAVHTDIGYGSERQDGRKLNGERGFISFNTTALGVHPHRLCRISCTARGWKTRLSRHPEGLGRVWLRADRRPVWRILSAYPAMRAQRADGDRCAICRPRPSGPLAADCPGLGRGVGWVGPPYPLCG